MKIQAGDYFLNSDQWSMWISKRVKSEKTGKMSVKRITGYRNSFDSLMADFAQRQTRGSEAEDVRELIRVMKQTMADMTMLKKTAAENDFKILRKMAKEGRIK